MCHTKAQIFLVWVEFSSEKFGGRGGSLNFRKFQLESVPILNLKFLFSHF
jgi:hypothetical protein